MVDERLKKYWSAIMVYHKTSTTKARVQMLAGFFASAARMETDPLTRHLFSKFQMKEAQKYAPANQNPEPPRFA